MTVFTYPGSPTTITLTGSDTINGDGAAANSTVSASSPGGENLTINNAFVTITSDGGGSTYTLNGSELNIGLDPSGNPANVQNVVMGTGPNAIEFASSAYANFSVNALNISGWSAGDSIIPPSEFIIASINYSGGNLSVGLAPSGGGATHTITVPVSGSSSLSNSDFVLASNGSSVSDGPFVAPCFTAGTRLASQEGEIEVQNVSVGDMLKLADERAVPVRWVGRLEISTRFGDRRRVLPIRIKASALADGVPARDLLISPDHAIFLNGILANAGALVNDVSIIRETAAPECFTYYHVELGSHELLLAEGCPAESFIDNVDRMNFSNWAEHGEPTASPLEEMVYLRAKSARQIPRSLREMLLTRAGALVATAA